MSSNDDLTSTGQYFQSGERKKLGDILSSSSSFTLYVDKILEE